jgi:hypothetical protein
VYFVNKYTIIIPGDTEMALEIISVCGEAADLLGEAGGQRAAGGRLLTVLAQRALSLLILLYTQSVQ